MELVTGCGKCLCQAVSFFAKTVSLKMGACHCGLCRKWGSGPLLSVYCQKEVDFRGTESIRVFESSTWGERGFCSRCGSHLFFRLKKTQEYFLPVGLFDPPLDFVFDHELFIDKKPSYYCFANSTVQMTEEEVFQKYGKG